MRCVIVDDENFFAERIEACVLDYYIQKGEKPEVHNLAANTLLNLLVEGKKYDLYFLDIEMPGVNGLELAEKIQKLDVDAKIIFITSYEKYALQSIKLRAYYYILKSEYKTELPLILERVWKEVYIAPEQYYSIESGINFYEIRFSNMIYLEKRQKYTFFYCRDELVYKERKSLAEVYDSLPERQFSLIDRGCIINLAYVKTLTRYEVVLKNGKKLSISRGMSPQVREDYAKYWSKKV